MLRLSKTDARLRPVIQGGMGIYISWWDLARKVASAGGIGTVSLTGMWEVLKRVLQNGDPGGHYRRALKAFPNLAIAEAVLGRYYVDGGLRVKCYRTAPMMALQIPEGSQQGPLQSELEEDMVVAGFAEVFLAKEGHDGPIAANLLEKIQLSLMPLIYGAMLADVEFLFIGAGLPKQVPGVLERFKSHQPAEYLLDVAGATREDHFKATFDPRRYQIARPLNRPLFFPIISIDVAAMAMLRGDNVRIDGWIIEDWFAGGHNAPPRSKSIGPDGQPEWGSRDIVNLDKIKRYGLPFYLAGAKASPEQLAQALAVGAAGIQVGTIFELCASSNLAPSLKHQTFVQWREGRLKVFSNPHSSTSRFPFKEALIDDTVATGARRPVIICDIGALRELYMDPLTRVIGYRCSAEPEKDFLRKGGNPADREGSQCYCNALFAGSDLATQRRRGPEPAVVTMGSEFGFLAELAEGYDVADVMGYLQPNGN